MNPIQSLGLLASLPAALLAQTLTFLPADHVPPASVAASMVFDTARERLVLFGGLPLNEPGNAARKTTWERADLVWQQRTDGPAARYGLAAAYDTVRQRMVVFGGLDANAQPTGETWEYDGAQWRQRYPLVNPAARGFHGMAFDSVRGKTVLFGGENGKGQLNDLWEWDGTNWLLRVVGAGPSPRRGVGLAFDPARGRTYVFGGGPLPSDELWSWDGTRWTLHQPALRPSARELAGVAFDIARDRLVVFGGDTRSGMPSPIMWEFDGSAWTAIAVPLIVANRVMPAMCYDATQRRVVISGGTSSNDDERHWSWDGTRFTSEAGRSVPLGQVEPNATATDRVRGRIVALLFDGQRNMMHSEWDGGRWLPGPFLVPSVRSGHAMAYDAARNRVVLFGGTSGSAMNDTWEFDGTQWAQLSPAASPPPRFRHAMAYDAMRQRVILHGGAAGLQQSLDDSWEFDGATWLQRAPSNTPPARQGHAMAYDPTRGTVVLTGGAATFSGVAMRDSWEWNGRDWSRMADLLEGRAGHAMAHWSAGNRLIVAGGQGEHGVMTWNGSAWAMQSAARTRGPVLVAVDPTRNSPLLFGHSAARTTDSLQHGNVHVGVTGSTAFGAGGCNATTLGLSVDAPYLGGPFTLEIWDRLPVQQPRRRAAVAWLLGTPANIAIGPCRLSVDLSRAVVLPDATNNDAHASLTLLVPATPALRGTSLAVQAAIADSASSIGLTLSNGQSLLIGG